MRTLHLSETAGGIGPGAIGIVVNPASGKDVRRLVARASVFDNQEKGAIVRRAAAGALAAGIARFRYMPDTHGITRQALDEVDGVYASPVCAANTASALDTTTSALALREAGCAVVIVLGGDGTNRAFAKGWPDAVLVPISTGTNNVFPHLVEATIAGAAAALVASGRVPVREAAFRAKAIRIEVEGESPDIALIDAVATSQSFIGARALLDASALECALLTRAVPSAVGVTSIGGLLAPLDDSADSGLWLELGNASRRVSGHDERCRVYAPIAPGSYASVTVQSVRRVALGERVPITGPCTLAFDGERERTLRHGQRAVLQVLREGPWVIDVERTLRIAAERGLFTGDPSGGTRAH